MSRFKYKDTIIKDIRLATEDEVGRIHNSMHIQCSYCKRDLFISLGLYRNDNFVIAIDNEDPMKIVYKLKCPYCHANQLVETKRIRVWHLCEES